MAEQRQARFKRKSYFINKELQGKYTFYFFLMVSIGSIAFTVIFSLLAADTLTIVYKDYDLKLGTTPMVLVTEILKAHWVFLLLSGIVVSLLSIYLTHRFAGPVYRFERSVDEMLKGRLDFDIRLRKNDSGKELAALMNSFTSALSAHFNELRRLSEGIDARAGEALRTLPAGSAAAAEALAHLKALNAQAAAVLSGFRTKGAAAATEEGLPRLAELRGLEGDASLAEALQAVERIKAFSEQLGELINSAVIGNEISRLAGSIETYLAHHSPALPGESREALAQTVAILNQIRELNGKLGRIVGSYPTPLP